MVTAAIPSQIPHPPRVVLRMWPTSPRKASSARALLGCFFLAALQCAFAVESGGGASAAENLDASSQQNARRKAEGGNPGCDGKGRDKCLGDDPYYIITMVIALTITVALLGAYIYCKVRDIGNIERGDGHVDKVVTDNYGHVVQGDPTTSVNSAPDIRLTSVGGRSRIECFCCSLSSTRMDDRIIVLCDLWLVCVCSVAGRGPGHCLWPRPCRQHHDTRHITA